ncbi:MAG: MerR family transcriptional regulator [Oscillospiraceae bacterium]|nr:MerR family transcriptional regulator [Oscillospiraceae bacterium]
MNENYRAIPEGYMRVGELARQAGVTVRTLQYYDKEGLLCPSAASEGGFRLYSDRDAVQLMQILALKQMGFSLSEIKQRLAKLDTPANVLQALGEQSAQIAQQIKTLSETLDALEKLKAEVAQIDSVNFKTYAAILANLQMKNEYYWMIKHFDDEMLAKFSGNLNMEQAQQIIAQINRMLDEAYKLHQKKVPHNSKKAQQFARDYWAIILQVTGGDMEMIAKLGEMFTDSAFDTGNTTFQAAQNYIAATLEIYLEGEYHENH